MSRIVDFTLDPLNEFRILILYDTKVLRAYDWTDGLLITVIALEVCAANVE